MSSLPASDFRIEHTEAVIFRVPTDPPVRTSFGIMYARPALLLRLRDSDGVEGWGEVWCNFPAVGAEHRARLFTSVLAPELCSRRWESPHACFDALHAHTHVLALQSGEPGPLAQVIAAIDMALWDIVAKRAGQPLWKLFGGRPEVEVYASGINPDEPLRVVEARMNEGYTAFKLKVGFGNDRDEHNVRTLRDALGPHGVLMVDANQGWDETQALEMFERLSPYDLDWIEEPVPADTPWQRWRRLAEAAPMRLAAGENLRGRDAFSAAATEGGIQVLQPDIGKWGGFSGCLQVGRRALEQNRLFCPHWLGAGIGLRASMHLKAAVGGPGPVEVDSNPNPLRHLLAEPDFQVVNGKVTLNDRPGLGAEPLLEAARPYLVAVEEGPAT